MDIAAIITAAAGLVTAVTALIAALRGQKQVQAQHAALSSRVTLLEKKT